jgi:dephospho-CoA kinase
MEIDKGKQGWVAGITGGIACGKSEVGRILAEQGVEVREADAVARELTAPGQAVFERVVEAFGPGVVGPDGRMDREALAGRILGDEQERRTLNAITHPEVMHRLEEWAGEVRARGAYGAAIVPLLFEVGGVERWDAVLCVVADEPTMMDRLRGRGLSAEESRRWIAAQMPVEEKARRADFVIVNTEDLDLLRRRTLDTWQAMLNKEREDHA